MSVNLHSFRGCAGIAGNVIGLGAVAKRQPVRGAIVAKPVLYEVPTCLALNLNWNTKQKNKKKKSDGRIR